MSSSFEELVLLTAIIVLTFIGVLVCWVKIRSNSSRCLVSSMVCLIAGAMLSGWPTYTDDGGTILKSFGLILVLTGLGYAVIAAVRHFRGSGKRV